jgi:hypothetical protein
MRKFVNIQTLSFDYSIPRVSVGGQCGHPDIGFLIQMLSAIHGKQLRTFILVLSFDLVVPHDIPVHLTFDDPQWKVLDELLCDVERFRVLGKVMLLAESHDLDFLRKTFNRGSDCGSLDMVKTAFEGLISTRRLQLVLRCVTIFVFSFYTST